MDLTDTKDLILDRVDDPYQTKKKPIDFGKDTNSIIPIIPRNKKKNKPLLVSPVEHTSFTTKRETRHRIMGKNKVAPIPGKTNNPDVDVELQKFATKGIDLEDVDTEEEKLVLLDEIRAIACPMRIKFLLREKLFSGPAQGLSAWQSWRYSVKRSWKKFKLKSKEAMYSLEWWGSSLHIVDGHMGTGVLSYFVFLRWLFGLNFLLFLLTFGFVVIPTMLLPEVDYTATSNITNVSLAYYCTRQYDVNVTTDVAQNLLDFFQGTGFLEKTYAFYGYYYGGQFLKGTATTNEFEYNVPLAYFLVAAVCLVISLFLMARYTASAFRDSIMDEHEQASGSEYCNSVFASWDYSLSDTKTAKLKHNSIYYDLASDLAEERFENERAERLKSGYKKCGLYTIRILINLFVLASLGAAGYLIYYVTTWSSEYVSENTTATGTDAYLLLLVQYMPSITITVLNALLPLIFDIVVKAEEYKQAFVVKITLIRTVFLRLASLAMLVVTMYTEIVCNRGGTCNTNQGTCTELKCWETYVGQQIYKLVILNFLVTILKVVLVEFPRRLITSKCKAKIFQAVGPPEFQIPNNVLDLVYTQTICWIGFFFAPLIPCMVILHLFIVFYVKLLSALFACAPSKRPYRASRTNSFFMAVLLLAFFLCCIPVGYAMSQLAPSRSCGPFRIYSLMYGVIQETVTAWPDGVESVYNVITSSAVVVTVMVLLALAVYYCTAIKDAHKEMGEVLRHQMAMESQDKQYLITRLQQLTGETAPLTKFHHRRPHTGKGKKSARSKTGDKLQSKSDSNRSTDRQPPPGDQPSQSPPAHNYGAIATLPNQRVSDW